MHLSITQSSQLQTDKVMHYLGQHLAALDLKAREKVHLLQRKLQLRQQVKRLKSVV
jgi:hypothetical protein